MMTAGRPMLDEMRRQGVSPSKLTDIPPDGTLVRFHVEGDKPGSKNGWAVCYQSPFWHGAFGSWRTGVDHQWRDCGSVQRLTAAELVAQRAQMIAMAQARERERARVHTETGQRAAELWARGRPATNNHPYVQSKGINAYGLRCLRDALMVPARCGAGTLWTLQFIGVDGSKRFLTGGRISGCYFAIGCPSRRLLLCEGMATGASLHMATGDAVAVCFSANNLKPVAKVLRAKYPDLRLVICADNDTSTPGNPGVTCARQAAQATGAYVAIPKFSNRLESRDHIPV